MHALRRKDFKAAARLSFQAIISIVAWAAMRAERAEAQTISGNVVSGNLSVTGTADVQGNSLQLGTPSGGGTGMAFSYIDGTPTSVPDQIQFVAPHVQTAWLWLYTVTGGAVQPQMWLDETNVLKLYTRDTSPVVGVQLNPAGTSIFANSVQVNGTDNELPHQALVGANSILTKGLADARYLQNGSGGISIGTASVYGVTYPTVALPDGTALGSYAFAGPKSTASGYYATSIGYEASATENGATAIGKWTTASGPGAFASGYLSTASGIYATASGYNAHAEQFYSNAIGGYAYAIGRAATASAYNSSASGENSVASGVYSTASGYGAVASGYRSLASAKYSVAAGYLSTASAYAEFVIGRYNVLGGNAASWSATDPLFVIGNGISNNVRANAFSVNKQGDTVVSGKLTANGTDNELPHQTLVGVNSILTQGLADARYVQGGSGGIVLGTGSAYGTIYPTVALPTGSATGAASFASMGATASGYYSTAIGFNAVASGNLSFANGFDATATGLGSRASGNLSTASGYDSTASGYGSFATGSFSNAVGVGSFATGDYSTALSVNARASGLNATAVGAYSTASGYNQVVVGPYNVTQGNPTTWTAGDAVFIVGNGQDNGHRSNAFIVTNQGDAAVSGKLTAAKLDVDYVCPKGDLSMGGFTAGALP
jgi:hypothetical protein